MKKSICLLLFLLCITMPVFSDTVYPASARYIIVNPNGNLKVATTFLLDTKTGKTWQLVKNSSGVDLWQQMEYDWYKQDGAYGGYTYKAPILTSP